MEADESALVGVKTPGRATPIFRCRHCREDISAYVQTAVNMQTRRIDYVIQPAQCPLCHKMLVELPPLVVT